MKDPLQQLLQALQNEDRPIPVDQLDELSDLDEDQLAIFRDAWRNLSNSRRRKLLEVLGQLAYDRIELSLDSINHSAMSDPDSEVRRIAIQNLWEYQNPDLVPPLLNALQKDDAFEVRAVAAAALGQFVWLGEIGEFSADLLHQIEEVLLLATQTDKSQAVCKRSLESLGYSSRSEVPQLIETTYHSGEETLKQSALFAMGRTVSKSWEPFVITELNNGSPKIRAEAARSAGELELQEALDPLIELLEDVDNRVRDAAIWALGQLGGEDATDALLFLLDKSEEDDLSDYLEEALDHLAFVDGTRSFLLNDFDDPEGLPF